MPSHAPERCRRRKEHPSFITFVPSCGRVISLHFTTSWPPGPLTAALHGEQEKKLKKAFIEVGLRCHKRWVFNRPHGEVRKSHFSVQRKLQRSETLAFGQLCIWVSGTSFMLKCCWWHQSNACLLHALLLNERQFRSRAAVIFSLMHQ